MAQDQDRGTWYAPSARQGAAANMPARWWRETDRDQAGRAMVGRARGIDIDQSFRRDELLIFCSLYSGRALSTLYQYGSVRRAAPVFGQVSGHRVTWNIAQSAVDTLAAQVSKNRVRALFQTTDGDFAQKMKAKGLTKFVDGAFYETNFYEDVADTCFIDASVMDGGVAKVYREPRKPEEIQIVRVLPFELLIDEAEAIYGKPGTWYQRQFVSRDYLVEQYSKGRDKKGILVGAIEAAQATDALATSRISTMPHADADMVTVYEAWRLPCGDEKGRHMIALDGAVLWDEEWAKERAPFAIYRDTPLQAGIWGKGCVEQVVGIQIELNRLLRVIQMGQKMHSVPRWRVPKGSIVTSHINNEIGAIIEYTPGQPPPEAFVAPAFASDIYQWAGILYESGFREIGITSLAATGQKPPGLDAGIALREYNDIQSTRFVKKGQRFENFCVAVARLLVDEARDAYETGKSVRVRAPGTKLIEQIEWKTVDMKEDAYVLRPYPTSILPTTPYGRLQTVRELIDSGLMPREHGLALLDMPDLEGAMNLQTAAYRDVERIMAKLLEEGEYEPPEPFSDLALAVKMGQSSWLRARNDGAPSERLDLLERWIDDARELMLLANPPPAAAVPGAGTPGEAGLPPGTPPEVAALLAGASPAGLAAAPAPTPEALLPPGPSPVSPPI